MMKRFAPGNTISTNPLNRDGSHFDPTIYSQKTPYDCTSHATVRLFFFRGLKAGRDMNKRGQP